MNGHEEESAAVTYSRANDTAARAIAYFSPVLFWGTVGMVTMGILMMG